MLVAREARRRRHIQEICPGDLSRRRNAASAPAGPATAVANLAVTPLAALITARHLGKSAMRDEFVVAIPARVAQAIGGGGAQSWPEIGQETGAAELRRA